MKSSGLFILFLLLLFMNACSSEKKLERLLHKKDGKWNIASILWTDKFPGDTTDYYYENGFKENAGEFIFEKDDVGKLSFVVNDNGYYHGFKWSVKNELIKVYRQFIFEGVNISFSGYQQNEHTIKLDGSIEKLWEDRTLTATIVLFR